jgi:tripartite-type tricarboxylate transporter receptor subunit TctC
MNRSNPVSRRLFVKSTSAAAAAVALPALSQSDWPGGPVRLLLGLPVGGQADVVARSLAVELEKRIGKPVLVDNRPGGQFAISVQALLNAPADGRTVLYIYNGNATVNATTKLYDLERDTAPVTQLSYQPVVMLVGGKSQHKSARELFAWAKANPGKLNFASVGAGTLEHLKWLQIEKSLGYTGTAIQYQGGPQSLQALMSGDIDVLVTAGMFAKMYAPTGAVKVISVLEPKRWEDFPEVPTIAEAGINVPPMGYWGGWVVKAGTPTDIVQRLYRELTAAWAAPSLNELLASTGTYRAVSKSPEEFRSLIRSEVAWMRESAKGLDLSK